jgi:hypothetical protein
MYDMLIIYIVIFYYDYDLKGMLVDKLV